MKKQLKIILVQYIPGVDDVLINVVRQAVDDDGIVYPAPFENVRTTQTALAAAGNPQWGDDEVRAVLRAETVLVTPAVPAVEEVKDEEGQVVVAAAAAVAEVRASRFGTDIEIV